MPNLNIKTIQEDIKQTRPFKNQTQEFIVTLLRTSALIKNQLESVLSFHQISLAQYNVLRILRGSKDMLPVMEIRERLVEPTPGITRLLAKLEQSSLIKRKQCKDDKRVFYCTITSKGLLLLNTLDPLLSSVEETTFKTISENTLGILIEQLNLIRQNMVL